MKIVDFYYVKQLQLIVCIDHRYCLAFRNLKKHFQRNSHHVYKDLILHTTLTTIFQLHVRDFKTIESSIDNSLIFYLFFEIVYQCRFSACKRVKIALSKHEKIVKKHLIKKHNIDLKKSKISRTTENILVIKVQSFCIENQYRSFVIRDDCSQFDEFENLHAESKFESSHAVESFETTQNVIAKKLDTMYVSSEQQ